MANEAQDGPVLLILVNRLFEWSQNFITRELTELSGQGARILIATRAIAERDDLTEREARLLKQLIRLPENPFNPACLLRHLKTAGRSPRAYLRAWKALFSLRHRKVSKLLRSLVCLFRAAAIAEEVVAMNVRLIHAHFLTAPGDTALYLSRLTGIPYGGTGHAMDLYKDNSGLIGKIAAAAYITTCTAANERYLKALPGVDPRKIHKLHHGIQIRAEEPVPGHNSPFAFIAVGRLVAKKGFSVLIEACGRLAAQGFEFRLDFVGVGPLEASLERQAEELGLSSRVRFRGYVPPNRMAECYGGSDVLIMPSIVDPDGDQDGLPNVCLEAMNHGLPIIGSSVSGIPEGVVHGENGWLVPPGEPAPLAEAMAEAIRTPRLFEMKRAARRIVTERFSLETNIRALRRLMEGAV